VAIAHPAHIIQNTKDNTIPVIPIAFVFSPLDTAMMESISPANGIRGLKHRPTIPHTLLLTLISLIYFLGFFFQLKLLYTRNKKCQEAIRIFHIVIKITYILYPEIITNLSGGQK
jgi:hypothetical protein